MLLFLKGIILGFSVAAPVGPVGLLCIRRTLQSGFFAGVSSGLGTACADTLYAAVAAFGLAALVGLVSGLETPVRFAGGLFLIWLAVRAFKAKSTPQDHCMTSRGIIRNFISTFFLTLTTPATVIAFTSIFAALGLAEGTTTPEALALIAGVFIGAMLWWSLLALLVTKARGDFLLRNLDRINKAVGVLLLFFAAWAIGGVFF